MYETNLISNLFILVMHNNFAKNLVTPLRGYANQFVKINSCE